jgi:DNA-binding transcriptional LysR family regulator
MPDLNVRAEMGMLDWLTRFLVEGVMQVGLMYMPNLRSVLISEKIIEEELVLAASWVNLTMDMQGRYVFVDWGPEFVTAHMMQLPELTNSGLSLALGAMAADFVVNRQWAAYLHARYIKKYLDAGTLHLVPDAPRFPYPVWAVWRDDLDTELTEGSRDALRVVSQQA